MAPEDQETVTETRDVTDLDSNEAVEEEVDDMLDISPEDRPDRELSDEPAGEEESDEEEVRPEIQKQMEEAQRREEEGDTEVEVSKMADESEDWENFDFEDQDWESIEKKEPEVVNVGGIRFLFKEPDEGDDVLNDLENAADGDGAARMRGMIEIVVDKPEITNERWDRLTFAQKLELAGRSADFLGLDDDFLEG